MTKSNMKFSLLAATMMAGTVSLAAGQAQATNGMTPHCIGVIKCGMGGAGIALATDASNAADNPALGAMMDNTAILSVGWFFADVKADIKDENSNGVANVNNMTSGADNFPNGSLGVNYRINPKLSVNLTIAPGGGGQTDWPYSRTNSGSGDSTDSKIDLQMLHIQPSVAYKPTSTSAIGVGVVISHNRIETDTLNNAFARATGPYDEYEEFSGIGMNVGGLWDVTDELAFGVAYRSPIYNETLSQYGNVFNGAINLPQQITAGVSYKPNASTRIAMDGKVIDYASIDALGAQPAADGGFGWREELVVRVGIEHDMNDELTVRAGFNHGGTTVDEAHAFANVLLPAVVEDHYTVGATYKLGNYDVSASAYYAPKNSITDLGGGDNFSVFGKGTKISMSQHGFQVGVSRDF